LAVGAFWSTRWKTDHSTTAIRLRMPTGTSVSAATVNHRKKAVSSFTPKTRCSVLGSVSSVTPMSRVTMVHPNGDLTQSTNSEYIARNRTAAKNAVTVRTSVMSVVRWIVPGDGMA
jgi:hypothetical protein